MINTLNIQRPTNTSPTPDTLVIDETSKNLASELTVALTIHGQTLTSLHIESPYDGPIIPTNDLISLLRSHPLPSLSYLSIHCYPLTLTDLSSLLQCPFITTLNTLHIEYIYDWTGSEGAAVFALHAAHMPNLQNLSLTVLDREDPERMWRRGEQKQCDRVLGLGKLKRALPHVSSIMLWPHGRWHFSPFD